MAPPGRYFRYDSDRGHAGQSKYFRLIGGLTKPLLGHRSRHGLIVAPAWPIIADGQGIGLRYGPAQCARDRAAARGPEVVDESDTGSAPWLLRRRGAGN
jgi:hypothetical protein